MVVTSEHHQHPASSLPQPRNDVKYTYVQFDEVSKTFFSYPSGKYPTDTLCWILKSKGRTTPNANASSSECCRSDPVDRHDNSLKGGDGSSNSSKTELFQRARVVETDDESRFLVRYSKGSTYRVRKSNLIPVLEKDIVKERIVLIASETRDYRRAAAVHTCAEDSFMEIGCDFGICTDRVRRVLSEVPHVHRDRDCSDTTSVVDVDGKVRVLGIDKSLESIEGAKERYPKTTFSLGDALTTEGCAEIRSLCREKLLGGSPSVVAVDIGGNRQLPHVLQCLDLLMNPECDDCPLPRLIIVKSRDLFAQTNK